MRKKIRWQIVVLLIAALFIGTAAKKVSQDQYFTGEVDLHGPFQIDNVTVTATAAEINAAADTSAGMTTASLTNGAALTLSASTPVVVISGIGGANDTTNTITIATPYPVGVEFKLIAASDTTNLIKIADSTTVLALGADVELDGTDSLTIFTVATNEAVEIGTANN